MDEGPGSRLTLDVNYGNLQAKFAYFSGSFFLASLLSSVYAPIARK